MRHEVKGGSWECFSGVKDMGERKKSVVIICRPQLDNKGAYFVFHKDKVILHKPEKMKIIDNGAVKVMVRE